MYREFDEDTDLSSLFSPGCESKYLSNTGDELYKVSNTEVSES